MLDTQADICVIRKSSVCDSLIINKNNIVNINGVTRDTIFSLGTVYVKLFFNDIVVCHEFHMVPDDFNIESDGIIGKDFIKKYDCILNFRKGFFTIYVGNNKTLVPILEGPDNDSFVIPPRCETIRRVKIKHDCECVIHNQEIQPGIFVSTTIVDPDNAYVRLLNTNEVCKRISKFNFTYSPLSDYKIFKIDEISKKDIRTQELLNILSSRVTQEDIKDEVIKLCSTYSDIFALETDKMTTIDFYSQKLRITDNKPSYVKNYRLPYTQKQEIERQVSKLLDNSLVEPSQSAYNSPVVLVPKKSENNEKRFRMCIDYRQVNKKLIPDKFPLPRIDEVLDGLGRAKYFSTIDLYNGFHQVPLDEDSRDITSFSTDKGSFRWKVLPFGLNVSPNSFSRMMSIAFSGLGPEKLFLYMDDIIVIGVSEKHHLNNLKSVFEVCRKMNLKINPKKCEFGKSSVTFLGHRCTDRGILPDDSKIDVLRNYPLPLDKDAVRRFVAFANYYRRFIKNFAEKCVPLNRLTRKSTKFEWTQECQKSFENIIKCIGTPPILAYPDFNKEFIITVDASKLGCGAILSQITNGEDLPICFASKSFTKGEQNKAVIEQELIAMHWGIKYFRPYIYGTKFLVRSDHRPLSYLFSLKDPNSRLTRIRLDLSEFDFRVEYIKGKENVGADALSRIYMKDLINNKTEIDKSILITTRSMSKRQKETSQERKNVEVNENKNFKLNVIEELTCKMNKKVPRVKTENNKICIYLKHRKMFEIDLHQLRIDNEKLDLETIFSKLERLAGNYKIDEIQWPKEDDLFTSYSIETFKEIGTKCLKKLTIVLIPRAFIVKDENQKFEIIKKLHDDAIFGGHVGQKKLYAKIRSNFYWKNMTKDIAKYVKECSKCQLNKVKNSHKEGMKIIDTPSKAFERVIIDTIGPFCKSTYGNQYAVTIICDLTKYLVTVPIPSKEAKVIATAILENFILIYGLMKNIRTDCGTEYRNDILKELLELLKIKHDFSTPYHHETVGTVERNHRTFNEYLRAYLNEERSDWDTYLKYFTYCYNYNTNSAFDEKFSPYELIFGIKPTTPINIDLNKVEPVYNIDNYSKEIKYRLQHTHFKVQEILHKNKLKNKIYYDRNVNPINLSINDNILIENEPRDKQRSIYSGPFKVVDIKDQNVEYYDVFYKKK